MTNMRNAWLMLIILIGVSVGAEQEIHRCTEEDGTVAYQETPCPLPAGDSDNNSQSDSEASAPTDDFFDFVNPFDEPEDAPARPEAAALAAPSPDRAECEKTTRDAIDAIDLEMREGYTKEEGHRYLAELLELTQQLRTCKQL